MNVPLLNVDDTIADLDRLANALRTARDSVKSAEQLGERVHLVTRAQRILAHRRQRATAFASNADIFGEPAYEILLDLYIADCAGRDVSVTSACIASGAPGTTGLRYLVELERRGLVARTPCSLDRRRTFVRLNDVAVEAIEAHLAAA